MPYQLITFEKVGQSFKSYFLLMYLLQKIDKLQHYNGLLKIYMHRLATYKRLYELKVLRG